MKIRTYEIRKLITGVWVYSGKAQDEDVPIDTEVAPVFISVAPSELRKAGGDNQGEIIANIVGVPAAYTPPDPPE